METIIRPAVFEDAPALARLAVELGYPVSAGEMHGRLARAVALGDCVRVAMLDGDLIGWCQASIVHSLDTGRFGEIRGLIVAERHRGCGVGQSLVEDAERWVAEQCSQRIRVRSNVTRTRARRFYERLGYVVSKTQNVFDKDLQPTAGAQPT